MSLFLLFCQILYPTNATARTPNIIKPVLLPLVDGVVPLVDGVVWIGIGAGAGVPIMLSGRDVGTIFSTKSKPAKCSPLFVDEHNFPSTCPIISATFRQ